MGRRGENVSWMAVVIVGMKAQKVDGDKGGTLMKTTKLRDPAGALA